MNYRDFDMTVPSWSEQIADAADRLFPDPVFKSDKPKKVVLTKKDLEDLLIDPLD